MKVLIVLSLIITLTLTKGAAKPAAAVKKAPKVVKAPKCEISKPGPANISMTDEKAQLALMYKVIPSWKDKELTRKNLSGAGGAKLLMYNPKDATVKPFGAVLKISQSNTKKEDDDKSKSDKDKSDKDKSDKDKSDKDKSDKDKSDKDKSDKDKSDKDKSESDTAAKINDAAGCALHNNKDTTVVKLAQGSNWFIQPSAGVEETNWKHIYSPNLVGELLARVHTTPTTWAEQFYPDVLKKNKLIQSWPKNTVSFWHAHNPTDDKTIQVLNQIVAIEKAIQWNSAISKNTVTIHGDFHSYNFLYADALKKRLRVIDLDTNWVGNPLADVARYIFDMHIKFKNRRKFAVSYLKNVTGSKKLKLKDVTDLLMDAELYKLFAPIHGLVDWLKDCPSVQKDPRTGLNALNQMISIWEKAKKDKSNFVKQGLYAYAFKKNKTWGKMVLSDACLKEIPFLRPGFEKPETFTETFQVRAKKMHKLKKFLENPKVWMNTPAIKKAGWIVEPWNSIKGGLKTYTKKQKSLPIFYGPLKSGSRRFIQGAFGKSGYPYAVYTGKMKLRVKKMDKKVQVTMKVKKWYQMSNIKRFFRPYFLKFMDQTKSSMKDAWTSRIILTPAQQKAAKAKAAKAKIVLKKTLAKARAKVTKAAKKKETKVKKLAAKKIKEAKKAAEELMTKVKKEANQLTANARARAKKQIEEAKKKAQKKRRLLYN